MARPRSSSIVGIIALVLLAVATVRDRVRRFVVAEHSMQPALDAGDFIVAIRANGNVRRGDIVVFADATRRDFHLVKRVIGVPGETISVRNGRVHIGGSALAEPWADGPTLPDGDWQLADDEVFVLGDARAASAGDSRHLGPVPVAALEWKVAFRYWPLPAIGRV